MTRERPGLAGSPRAGGAEGPVSPKRERHPLPRSRGFPAGHRPLPRAGDPAAAGAPSPRLVQCPGHGVFPQRRPRHSPDSPPLPSPPTCGFSEPREGAGAAEAPEPGAAGRPDDPLLRPRMSAGRAPALSRSWLKLWLARVPDPAGGGAERREPRGSRRGLRSPGPARGGPEDGEGLPQGASPPSAARHPPPPPRVLEVTCARRWGVLGTGVSQPAPRGGKLGRLSALPCRSLKAGIRK